MKRLVQILVVLVVPFLLLACDSVAPSPGEEIVLVKKPYIFGRGGIEAQPVRAGRVFIAPSTDQITVNVYPTTIKEAFTDLMSSDQQPLDFDTAIQVQVTSSVDLVRNFGLEWYQNKVAPQYRSIVRQSVRRRTMTDMTLNPAAIEATDREVFDVLSRYMREQKLPVRLIDVTLGRANPPEEIKQQRIATATQKARQETEKERKLAEDQRAAAEESRARADNAYRTAMQLSPEQFLQLESIKMQREVCSNPKNPCTFFLGGTAVPTLPVR